MIYNPANPLPYIPVILLIFYNVIYFLIYSKDMNKRRENKLAWLFAFILLGPLAVSLYKSYRNPKDSEPHSAVYKHQNLAKNIVLPWSIYWLTLPGIYLSILALSDIASGTPAEYIPEMVFWFAVIYIIRVIPTWLVSLIIPVIIIFVMKPRKV